MMKLEPGERGQNGKKLAMQKIEKDKNVLC